LQRAEDEGMVGGEHAHLHRVQDALARLRRPDGARSERLKERQRRLLLVSDFMAWKLSPGFVMASERHEADALVSIGVLREDYYVLISLIERKPLVQPSA
jgi:hypothetical protein